MRITLVTTIATVAVISAAPASFGEMQGTRQCLQSEIGTTTVPSNVTFTVPPEAGAECFAYRIQLRFGDTLRMSSVDGASIGGQLYLPLPGNKLARQACSDGYSSWTVGGYGPRSLDCVIPKTGDYYLHLTSGNGRQMRLSTTVARRELTRKFGSCSIGSAPFLRLGVVQLGSGMTCPSGRQYFRIKLAKRGQKVLFEWTTVGESPSDYPDSGQNAGVYPPGTNVFTIDKTQTCGQSTYYGTGAQNPLELCTVRKPGTYIIAFGYLTTELHIRVKQ